MPLTTNIATATQLKKDLKDQQKKTCKILTMVLGKISAKSFLYLLTGLRELGLSAGQQTHMFPQAGKIFLEMKPICSKIQTFNKNRETR